MDFCLFQLCRHVIQEVQYQNNLKVGIKLFETAVMYRIVYVPFLQKHRAASVGETFLTGPTHSNIFATLFNGIVKLCISQKWIMLKIEM